jgi:hypothetical protein
MLPTEFLTLLTTLESAAHAATFMNSAEARVLMSPTVRVREGEVDVGAFGWACEWMRTCRPAKLGSVTSRVLVSTLGLPPEKPHTNLENVQQTFTHVGHPIFVRVP